MFDRVKRIYWNLWLDIHGIPHGRLFSLSQPVYIVKSDGKITFGDGVGINRNVHINASAGGEIIIGNNVHIGPNVVIRAADHDVFDILNHVPGKIIIEDNVWIAANCVVLKNVRIGSGSVIGAGSIVTHDIPENVVAVGNPCRPIKKIYRESRLALKIMEMETVADNSRRTGKQPGTG